MWISCDYADVRRNMRPGDIIAFQGRGFISKAICFICRCPVSHVGIVLYVRDLDGTRHVDLMESTTLAEHTGVQLTHMSERIKTYDGRVWWLPLSDVNREEMDVVRFLELMKAMRGRKYDRRQAAHFAIDRLRLWSQSEDPSRLFCSELAALGLKAAGILPIWFNSSEFRPHDLVNLNLYADNYYQLSGTRKEIPCFNKVPINEWRNK